MCRLRRFPATHAGATPGTRKPRGRPRHPIVVPVTSQPLPRPPMQTRILSALLLLAAAPGAAQTVPTGFPAECRPGEVEVMLLGTYHFAGSSGDAIQTPAEDVLGARRQAELEALARRLAEWGPQQIAVEWPLSFADSTQARYRRYLEAGASRSPNEVVQIGFRLARRLGHEAVYPIDHPLPLGNDSTAALFARRADLRRGRDTLMAAMRAQADSAVAWRRGATIAEHLHALNTEEALRGGNSLGMFGGFLAAGEGGNLGGPQLLARWYERNIVMAHNLTRVLRPETRRVLLIVGAGHVPPLRNILHESPAFCPVSPLPLLR